MKTAYAAILGAVVACGAGAVGPKSDPPPRAEKSLEATREDYEELNRYWDKRAKEVREANLSREEYVWLRAWTSRSDGGNWSAKACTEHADTCLKDFRARFRR